MPNWCENVLVVGHADQKMLRRFVRGYKSGDLGQEFVPMPADYLEDQARCDWRDDRWGTKWEFGQGDHGGPLVQQDGKVKVRFDTAWSPPFAFYLELRRLGFDVDASYYEPGVEACGRVFGDKCTAYGIDCWSPPCVRRFIDHELVEMFGIDDGSRLDEQGSCGHGDKSWFDVRSLETFVAGNRALCVTVQKVVADIRANRPGA